MQKSHHKKLWWFFFALSPGNRLADAAPEELIVI
jgi:hypothetical protein